MNGLRTSELATRFAKGIGFSGFPWRDAVVIDDWTPHHVATRPTLAERRETRPTLAEAEGMGPPPATARQPGSEKVLQVFRSFEDADEADEADYAGLTPRERVDILLDIIAAYRESLGEAAERLERVYRVIDLQRS